ncbi:MAG: UDP-3-O-acyl-N-acetylglucosamine deacetylase [Halocynthiibacter sp.]
MQATLKSTIEFLGHGLHSNAPVKMVLKPAAANVGIWFNRVDLDHGMISARYDSVVPSQLCTLIRNDDGAEVSTIEHIMAALAGCGVHNAMIDIDGPEVPIFDGSSKVFVEKILETGIQKQAKPVRILEILKPVEFRNGDAFARIEPSEEMVIDFEIDFTEAAIGNQSMALTMANGTFLRELSDCRTFCRQSDVDMMQANGLALGGTLDNALVFDDDKLLSPSGQRRDEEPVRHKMLDALGDLYLAGGPLMGRYTGFKAGHAMTNQLLRLVFADPSNFRFVECDDQKADRLPGAHIKREDIAAFA